MRFSEEKTLNSAVRLAYENYFAPSERVPSNDMQAFMSTGNLKLYVTYNDQNEFVAGTFVTVGMVEATPILFQSFFFVDNDKTSDQLESLHVRNLLSTLRSDYPNARLVFEAKDASKLRSVEADFWKAYTNFASGLGAQKMWDVHRVPGDQFQLWGYPVNGDSPSEGMTRDQLAQAIYTILRFCYELSPKDAADYLKRDGFDNNPDSLETVASFVL